MKIGMKPPELTFDAAQKFDLTSVQAEAAQIRGLDLAVTAGAGSGKTLTLVARYLGLLADGLLPRQVTAITFTEKAAREMRNRVRQSLSDLRLKAGSPAQAQFWANLESQMDSARIGTIHGLCAEILRAHPVEARLDPQFNVLDENAASALRALAIETSLQQILAQPESSDLISAFNLSTLESLAQFALDHRLDLAPWLEKTGSEANPDWLVRQGLERFLSDPQVIDLMDELRGLQTNGEISRNYTEKLAVQVGGLIADWDSACQAFQAEDHPSAAVEAAAALFHLRKPGLDLTSARKESPVKNALVDLRQIYERGPGTWLTEPPDLEVEVIAAALIPTVRQLFSHTQQVYHLLKEERQALDFDDLEGGAFQLLQNPVVRQHWQSEIQSVLVDEFQDTNQRQRKIIEDISGRRPGKLFVVGDGRQSIYRFRGADVAVFQRIQADISGRGGRLLSLDMTFRSHAGLNETLGQLLAPSMAPSEDPPPDYWVAYSALQPARPDPLPAIHAPFIEFVLGQGETAKQGRPAAALALSRRLLELKEIGQIDKWDHVALLFRSTRTFTEYEDALEKAGIPTVTVAGRGFYDRPEIRDFLNLLRSLADPWDDLAVAGLLRSPAFGLPDAALFRLRWPQGFISGGKPQSLYQALSGLLAGSASPLSSEDTVRAVRAARFMRDFSPLVDRLPVADLLKRIVDELDLRAILATARNRLWRNLDKLLADAQTSGLIQVSAFLEYLQTLRDVGAREGEASVESQGAVRLMSIHKSKGLEFDWVVLADAANRGANSSQPVIYIPEVGLGLKPDRPEGLPLAYRLVKKLDDHQELAENRRLLYVALTRAREKVIISGHLTKTPAGWLKLLTDIAGFDLATLTEGTPQTVTLPTGQTNLTEGQTNLTEGRTYSTAGRTYPTAGRTNPTEGRTVSCSILPYQEPGEISGSTAPSDPAVQPKGSFTDVHLVPGKPLYLPVVEPPPAEEPETESQSSSDPAQRPWRAAGDRQAPSVVVGTLVHRAIQSWCFPGDTGIERMLDSASLNAGLVAPEQRANAIQLAERLLIRLHRHPLWAEINSASDRFHEVPYVMPFGKYVESGYIDLLYHHPGGWRLVDFKTDELHDQTELDNAVFHYRPKILRYKQAATRLLTALRLPGSLESSSIVFLDYQGQVQITPIS